jgi:hypothetical protein
MPASSSAATRPMLSLSRSSLRTLGATSPRARRRAPGARVDRASQGSRARPFARPLRVHPTNRAAVSRACASRIGALADHSRGTGKEVQGEHAERFMIGAVLDGHHKLAALRRERLRRTNTIATPLCSGRLQRRFRDALGGEQNIVAAWSAANLRATPSSRGAYAGARDGLGLGEDVPTDWRGLGGPLHVR